MIYIKLPMSAIEFIRVLGSIANTKNSEHYLHFDALEEDTLFICQKTISCSDESIQISKQGNETIYTIPMGLPVSFILDLLRKTLRPRKNVLNSFVFHKEDKVLVVKISCSLRAAFSSWFILPHEVHALSHSKVASLTPQQNSQASPKLDQSLLH